MFIIIFGVNKTKPIPLRVDFNSGAKSHHPLVEGMGASICGLDLPTVPLRATSVAIRFVRKKIGTNQILSMDLLRFREKPIKSR